MAEETTTDVPPVAPETHQPRRAKKRLLIVGGVVAAVLVLGAGGYGIWRVVGDQDNSSETKKVEVKTPKDNTELVDGVNQYIASGDYESAQKVISSNPELAKTRDAKMTLASIYYNQQKLDEALAAYLDIAKEYGWTANLAHLVAGIYVEKNDKQQAITHYQKEIELLKADTKDPLSKSQITLVENKIKALQQ